MHRPDWIDKDPQDWPPSARIAYGILLRAALRRLNQEQRPEGTGELMERRRTEPA